MRRMSISLIVVAVLVSVVSIAAAQDFTRISLTVPDGWTGSESDSGRTVYINKDDGTARISIQTVMKNGRTLQEIANEAFNIYSGIGSISTTTRGLFFQTSTGAAIVVFDSSIYPNIRDDVCCLMALVYGTIPAEFLDSIPSSIIVNDEWADGTGTGNTTGNGTVKDFTCLSVKVADGWTGSENATGDTVYITNDSKTSLSVTVQPVAKDGRTLLEVTQDAFSDLGGTGDIREMASGLCRFTTSGGVVVVFDNQYQYRTDLLDGFCIIMYAVGSNGTELNNVLNDVLESVTINESWANGTDNTTDNNTTDNNTTDNNTGNNTTGNNTDNNSTNNNTGNTEGVSSSGGGGGCSSGIGALALLLSGLAFFRKK